MSRTIKFLIIIFYFILFNSKGLSQSDTEKLPEYSYSDFFELVQNEKDSVFKMYGAVIQYNSETDTLFKAYRERETGNWNLIGMNNDSTILVNKQLDLSNVHFKYKILRRSSADEELTYGGVLNNIVFKKEVESQSNEFMAVNCVFEKGLRIPSYCDEFRNEFNISITNCTIKESLSVRFDDECNDFSGKYFSIIDNCFVPDSLPFLFIINPGNSTSFNVTNNSCDNVDFLATIENYNRIQIKENIFLKGRSDIRYSSPSKFGHITLTENNLGEIVFFSTDVLSLNTDIDWNQLNGKVISNEGRVALNSKWREDYKKDLYRHFYDSLNIEILEYYQDSFSISNVSNYNAEMALKGAFYNLYKSKFNRKYSNEVYVEMKNLETKRFKYLYNENKSFRNYFQWKINQFLKLFSEFGTEPAKAVVVAMYVIFIFAFFYLFFPNSWDENNRHRIMNRMLFFTKYFKRKDGMKEVFEEENKSKVMAYEDFKNYMEESKSEVPPYFIALTKPIYAASVANYRLRSKILSRTDILKGKWAELKPRRKATTSIIMAFWLLGILLYDLFVKFFNALMLSINTFSTLGFGEIPIKGIPRYLAILQGFLGWFMLSIFSVSLISQLLN